MAFWLLLTLYGSFGLFLWVRDLPRGWSDDDPVWVKALAFVGFTASFVGTVGGCIGLAHSMGMF